MKYYFTWEAAKWL